MSKELKKKFLSICYVCSDEDEIDIDTLLLKCSNNCSLYVCEFCISEASKYKCPQCKIGEIIKTKCYGCSKDDITQTTLKCSNNCSIDMCEECIIDIIITSKYNCPHCKIGELAKFTSMPTLIKASQDVLQNNNIDKFIETYRDLQHFSDSNIVEKLDCNLDTNLNTYTDCIMKFRILDNSGPSTTNNIYKLIKNENYIFKMVVYSGCCRCCYENYLKIDIVFSDFEKNIINTFFINDIEVFDTIHNKLYEYIKETFLKRDYINYLRFKNSWFNEIKNIDLLQKIVDIPDNIQICECGHYGIEIITPCPNEILKCPHSNICKTYNVKRKDIEEHITECEKTEYQCKYYGEDKCNKKLLPNELLKHLDLCEYRGISCENKKCNWGGIYKNLKKHTLIKLDGSSWMPWESEESKICFGK
jgi:hypothetical protein